MIAIILAAGKGSRLYPYTINKPKCLVNYKKKSILSHQLAVFKKKKIIKKIYVVTGYMSSQIKNFKIIKKKNHRFHKTNMVYSLFLLSKLFNGKEDIIISYGDIIFKEKIITNLIKEHNELSTVVDLDWLKYWKKRFSDPLSDAETLKFDKNYFIYEIGNKTKNYKNIHAQYVGLIKIKKEITKKIFEIWKNLKIKQHKSKIDNMYFTDFLRILIKRKFKLKAVRINRGWLEFDNPSDLDIEI